MDETKRSVVGGVDEQGIGFESESGICMVHQGIFYSQSLESFFEMGHG
jgi:hypothetical protein